MTAQTDNAAECVLLVETDVLARFPLADYLRECGYKVLEASTTDEAVSLLNEPSLPVSVALIDARAAGAISGFALAHRIRGERPGIDVVLAGSTADAVDSASEICADGPALAKPYERTQVLDLIKRLRAARDRQS